MDQKNIILEIKKNIEKDLNIIFKKYNFEIVEKDDRTDYSTLNLAFYNKKFDLRIQIEMFKETLE